MGTPEAVAQPEGIGERIRMARALAGLGSKELSAEIGKHKQFVSNIELGSKKAVDARDLLNIAEQLSGRGQLIGLNKWDVFRFLIGDDDWDINVRRDGTMMYRHSPSDLHLRSVTEPANRSYETVTPFAQVG